VHEGEVDVRPAASVPTDKRHVGVAVAGVGVHHAGSASRSAAGAVAFPGEPAAATGVARGAARGATRCAAGRAASGATRGGAGRATRGGAGRAACGSTRRFGPRSTQPARSLVGRRDLVIHLVRLGERCVRVLLQQLHLAQVAQRLDVPHLVGSLLQARRIRAIVDRVGRLRELRRPALHESCERRGQRRGCKERHGPTRAKHNEHGEHPGGKTVHDLDPLSGVHIRQIPLECKRDPQYDQLRVQTRVLA